MKWYFASRTRHQKKIHALSEFLKKQGEEIVSDWIYTDSQTLMPYTENLAASQDLSERIVTSILDCDNFVLISDPEGTDMFIELGIALARTASKSPSIYIIGKYSKRSLMQLHPSTIHLETIEELFKQHQIDHSEIELPLLD